MTTWNTYSFIVKEREDGTPWIGVATPLDAPATVGTPTTSTRLGDASVALRLNLCATYADAREIADFINKKLHILNVSRPLDAAALAVGY